MPVRTMNYTSLPMLWLCIQHQGIWHSKIKSLSHSLQDVSKMLPAVMKGLLLAYTESKVLLRCS